MLWAVSGQAHGTVKTHAHESLSVLPDRHQRGDADQTEQFIPTIKTKILQASGADAVLCKNCQGETPWRTLDKRKPPEKLQGELGSGSSSGDGPSILELCFVSLWGAGSYVL